MVSPARSLRVITSWYLFRSQRTIPADDVQAIKSEIGMTSGQQAYYDLCATTKAGPKIKLAGGIKEKREAQWLSERITAQMKPGAAP